MRKKILEPDREVPSAVGAYDRDGTELDLHRLATVLVSSEASEFPVDNAFDDQRGRGASRWVAAETGEQTLILELDAPQRIRRVELEVEETEVARTQELTLAASSDGGRSYRELVRQEYCFSPPGTTFERESWSFELEGVTHLRLRLWPDKGGRPCRASVTSLVVR